MLKYIYIMNKIIYDLIILNSSNVEMIDWSLF